MTKKNETNDVVKTNNSSPETSPRHPYHPPTFVRYGSVANLVQAMEGFGNDGGGGFDSDTLS